MKSFTIGHIFCNCSKRMHVQGLAVRIYENTPNRKQCPNCGKLRKIKILEAAKNV